MLNNANFVSGVIAASNILLNGEVEDATFDTTPNAQSGAFPATGEFLLVLWDASYALPESSPTREIVRIKSTSGNVLTVKSRNQEGTTHSGDWGAGTKYALTLTAESLLELYGSELTVNDGTTDLIIVKAQTVANLETPSSQIRAGTVINVPPLQLGDAEAAGIYTKIDPTGDMNQLVGWYGEITDKQADTEAAFCKVVHFGAGDAFYVAMRGSTSCAAYEAAAFTDGSKGFISTMQAAGLANCTLFNALWEQATIPNYGMFYADQAIARALTIRKYTGANDGYEQIRILENDVTRSRFSVYNDGKIEIASLVATAGTKIKDSPDLLLRGAYWDGAGSLDVNFIMRHVVTDDDPASSECRWLIGRTGFEAIVAILRSGVFDIQGNAFYTGDVYLNSDSKYYWSGAGLDMKIGYDGTKGVIKTNLVAASDLNIDCGAAKTIVLDTPVYNDANVGSLVLQTGGTLPGIVEILDNDGDATGIYTRGFAIDEQGSGCIEVPHDYKEGTDLSFHIHWGANDAPSGTDNVKWALTYSISRGDNTFPDSTTIYKEIAYDTRYEWLLSTFDAIAGATKGVDGGAIKIGDQFNFTVKRVTADGDAYSGEALVATMGFHYQTDTLGSRQIGTK